MVKITLFGLGGTGTSTLAKLFADKNNYTFMSSGNIFREKAKEHNLDVYEFNKLCETSSTADKSVDIGTEEFGKSNDNFIFESRLAWNFIPDSIKIKLHCDIDERVKRICERDGGNFEETKAKTITREQSEQLRYKNYYDIEDYTRDEHFDIILNSTNSTPEELVLEIEKLI